MEQKRYKICSDADLKGKQAFFFKVKQKPPQPTITEYALQNIESIENLPNIRENPSFPTLLRAKEIAEHKIKTLASELNIKSYQEYLNEINKRIRQLKSPTWKKGSKLDCWHNFLAYVEYPSVVKDRWVEILLGYQDGSLTKEQYEKGVEEIKEMEEMFQIDMREGNAQHGFTKPTTYQPLRLRLYGSQKAVNDLVNKFLRFNPLNDDTVPNSPTRYTIENAFEPIELYQLRENKLITPEFIEEQLAEVNEMDLDDVWEKAEEGVREGEVEYELDNWDEIWGDTDQIYDNMDEFREIEEDLFGSDDLEGWNDSIEIYHQLGERAYKRHLKQNIDKLIIVRDGEFYWSRDEQTSDFIDSYDWLFRNMFPTVPLPIIRQRVKQLSDAENKEYWVWEGREDFIAYITHKKFTNRIEQGLVDLYEDLEYRYYEGSTPEERLGTLEEFPRIIHIVESANTILNDNDYEDYFEIKDYISKPIIEKLKDLKLLGE